MLSHSSSLSHLQILSLQSFSTASVSLQGFSPPPIGNLGVPPSAETVQVGTPAVYDGDSLGSAELPASNLDNS